VGARERAHRRGVEQVIGNVTGGYLL